MCDQAPCQNDGVCLLDDVYGYTCRCADPFTGRHCQVDPRTVTCESRGGCCVSWRNDSVVACDVREDNYRCYCDESCLEYGQCCVDFKEFCEWEACYQMPCQNGGSCVEDELADYRCFCEDGFTGRNCEVNITAMLCADLGGCCVPWLNDSTPTSCSNIHPIAPYRCYCDADCVATQTCCHDFEDYCEWDACKTSPCLNEAECVLDELNGYICVCRDGYTGTLCEVDINAVTCEAGLGGCCVSWRDDDVRGCSVRASSFRCYCDESCVDYDQCCVDFVDFCEWNICRTEPCAANETCLVQPGNGTVYDCEPLF